MEGHRLYDAVRRPEHTGENRCLPCTAVNLLLAAALSAPLVVVSVPLAVGTFAVCLGFIYVRGYLVPGTPRLTQRYLPDRVLRAFGKGGPGMVVVDRTPMTADDLSEPEEFLRAAGAIVDAHDDDVRLAPDFRDDWQSHVDRLRPEGEAEDAFADLLGTTQEDLVFLTHGDAYVVNRDGSLVGTWESRPAFVADVAADRALDARVAGWRARDPQRRSELVRGLRPLIEACPACGGSVSLDTETVESCCSSRTVLAASCTDCGARLFEVDAPGQRAQ